MSWTYKWQVETLHNVIYVNGLIMNYPFCESLTIFDLVSYFRRLQFISIFVKKTKKKFHQLNFMFFLSLKQKWNNLVLLKVRV